MSNPILTSKCTNCEAEFDLEWFDAEYEAEFCPFCGESLDTEEELDEEIYYDDGVGEENIEDF